METLTQTQTFEEAVLKTVLFWSDKSFRTLMNQNNGDDSPGGATTFMLMNMLAMSAKKSVTDEKIKAFEDKLTELLMAVKDKQSYQWQLDVDYHPCQMLAESAEFAGIDTHCFPCKTFTRIEKDHSVVAKYQYGGPFVKL